MDKTAAEGFQNSPVWQRAHQFVLAVYHYSDYFPQKEIYGLTSQLRRAAASVPTTIAEGLRANCKTDKARSLSVARGTLEECRYYLILAKDLGYGDNPELMPLLDEISKTLGKDAAALQTSDS
jgi:four helix bundle protein